MRRPRLVTALAGLGAGVAAAIAFGPRPTADPDAVVRHDVGDDPEAWLAARDDAAPDLRPGSRSLLRWAAPDAPGPTDVVVVYLHGFSADPVEISPVPERVAAALGANLLSLRLTGHGQDGAAMAEATAEDWMADGLAALDLADQLGDQVLVMGTSTGGTLALWLALEGAPHRIDGLVLVSPNLRLAPPIGGVLRWPWVSSALLAFGPAERSWPATGDRALHWTHAYPTRALWPMLALVQRVADLDLSTGDVPTLVLQTAGDDRIVDAGHARRALATWGAPVQVVRLQGVEDPEQHVIAGDLMSPATTAAAVGSTTRWWAASAAR